MSIGGGRQFVLDDESNFFKNLVYFLPIYSKNERLEKIAKYGKFIRKADISTLTQIIDCFDFDDQLNLLREYPPTIKTIQHAIKIAVVMKNPEYQWALINGNRSYIKDDNDVADAMEALPYQYTMEFFLRFINLLTSGAYINLLRSLKRFTLPSQIDLVKRLIKDSSNKFWKGGKLRNFLIDSTAAFTGIDQTELRVKISHDFTQAMQQIEALHEQQIQGVDSKLDSLNFPISINHVIGDYLGFFKMDELTQVNHKNKKAVEFYKANDFDKAIVLFKEVLSYWEQVYKLNDKYKESLISTLYNLGSSYLKSKQPAEAEPYLLHALEGATSLAQQKNNTIPPKYHERVNECKAAIKAQAAEANENMVRVHGVKY